MRTSAIFLLALAALCISVNAQEGVPLGSSCLSFNSSVCVGSTDGTTWENIADCGTPFCHETYIVCSSQTPITMRCANETVWSQRNQTCINRDDGVGSCPVQCGKYNPMSCQNMTDGSRLPNPNDCAEGGMPTTFLYCYNEVPIVTECPMDTFYVEAINVCINAAGLPEYSTPEIPGMEDDELPVLPADMPNKPKPGTRRNRRTRPVLQPGQVYTTFTFYLRGKDLTEVTDYMVEEAVANATSANILAIEQLAYINRLGLTMRDFNMPLTPANVKQIEEALQGLLAASYEDINKREVRVRAIQSGVSTASIDTTAQPVSAVVDLVSREELATAMDVQNSLPNFEEVLAMGLDRIANNTAEILGVTDDLAAYFKTENTMLDDASMIINVTLLHTLGKTGNRVLETAVEEGDMAAAFEDLFGQNLVAVMSLDNSVAVPTGDNAEAPAPSTTIPIQATPVTPINAAFASSVSGAVMAVVGAACLSLFML